MADVGKIQPLNDNIEQVLKTFYSFTTPEVSSPKPLRVTHDPYRPL